MWWEILKNTSFTDKEYRHKIDGYNVFALMFSDSKPSWMEVNTENHLPFTTLNQLIMNNDFQNKLNALFKFKKGSFAIRFDGVTVYVKLKEQENLHHFILEIDFMNTTPRFEAYAEEEGLESKYKFEVNFIKEKNTDESKNVKPENMNLVVEDFIDFSFFNNKELTKLDGEQRMDYFKKELRGWLGVTMGVHPSKNEVFKIYEDSIMNKYSGDKLDNLATSKYYYDRFEIVWEKIRESLK